MAHASRSQLFINDSILHRAKRKEPLAIIMIALGFVFVGIWFTALIFDASDGKFRIEFDFIII